MKLMIDIPDNELKDHLLRNIHLLISNGIITEVCIKKYNKDKNPYFMDLNYAPLEEYGDCVSRQAVLEKAIYAPIAKVVTEDKVIYRKIVFVDEIENIPPVKPVEKVGHWIELDDCSNSGYYCSECRKRVVKEGWSDTVKIIKYCPNCGAKMEEVEE